MAKLTSLPRELLISLLEASPTVQDAARFSAVSKKTRAVWMSFGNQIANTILTPRVPAYEEAVKLAVAQTRFVDPSQMTSPAVWLWIPTLLQTHSLASSLCSKFQHWLDHLPRGNYRCSLSFTSLYKSYYTLRRLVFAYSNPPYRGELLSELQAASIESVRTHYEMCSFMYSWMDDDEQRRQLMLLAEQDMPSVDDVDASRMLPEWDFAFQSVDDALSAKLHG